MKTVDCMRVVWYYKWYKDVTKGEKIKKQWKKI